MLLKSTFPIIAERCDLGPASAKTPIRREVSIAVRALTNEQLKEFECKGSIDVCGQTLSAGDIKIALNFSGESKFMHAESYDGVLAMFDMEQDESLRREGLAREIISRVQRMRKTAGLSMEDEIEIFYDCEDPTLLGVIAEHGAALKGTLRVNPLPLSELPAYATVVLQSDEEVNGAKVGLTITRACLHCIPDACRHLVPASAAMEQLQEAVAAISFDVKSNKQVGTNEAGFVRVNCGGSEIKLEMGTHLRFTLAAIKNVA